MRERPKIDLGLTGYDEMFMNDQERAENRLPKMQSVIDDEQPPSDAIITHPEGVDLLPSNIELSGMERRSGSHVQIYRRLSCGGRR